MSCLIYVIELPKPNGELISENDYPWLVKLICEENSFDYKSIKIIWFLKFKIEYTNLNFTRFNKNK